MTPYYADDAVTLYHGDALDVIRSLPDASVDCCVTSPPYFGLRDYGVAPVGKQKTAPAALERCWSGASPTNGASTDA